MIMFKNLIICSLLRAINCEATISDSLTRRAHAFLPENPELFFLFASVWMASILRLLLIRFKIPTPCEFFMIIFGILWGIIAYHNKFILLMSQVMHLSPHEILFIYLPAYVFYTTFCVDVSIFLKTLPQIMVIGVPVNLLTGVIFGTMTRLVIDPDWSIIGAILFGLFCTPVNPASIVYLLKQQSSFTKQISVLLEGEAIISVLIADVAQSLVLNYILGFVKHWYQPVCIILRYVIFDTVTGYLVGLLGRYLIRKMYTNRLSVFVLSFGIPFCIFAVNKKYISGFGGIGVAVVGAMMGIERATLAKDIDKFLVEMWQVNGFTLDVVLCTTAATLFSSTVAPIMHWSDYIKAVVTFLMFYAIRFGVFLLFSPILSRLGYGMDLKNMIVCVWSGLKGPFSLVLVRIFMVLRITEERSATWFFYIIIIYLLSLLINGSFTRKVLDFLGFREISRARQINMDNCMKHVFTRRYRTVGMLKMDRFLVDANWPLIIEATNIRHPYHTELEQDQETGEFFLGYHFTFCPDCQKEIPQEPTPQELKDMTREAKMRILKAKKMSYSRQFENGMMSKEAIRTLTQAVELAMDSEKAVIELDGLQKRFTEESWINRYIRNRVQELNKTKQSSLPPPRRYFRRICYNIVVNKSWERFMIFVVLCSLIFLVLDFFYHPKITKDYVPYDPDKPLDYVVIIAELVYCSLCFIEIVMKILAYSWIRIWPDGCRIYFRSVWNNIDFIAMIASTMDVFLKIFQLTKGRFPGDQEFILNQILDILRILRFVRLFKLIEICYPKLIRDLDRNVDTKMAFTYELGKSYATGETEILDMLPYMIDNKKIREEVKGKIEADRVLITKLLGLVQKEKPWIAITVKTKQAIRTILKSINEAINHLKRSGWVDSHDQERLEAQMGDLYKKVNAMKTVQPSAPKVIFKEIPWMGGEDSVIDFLFENVTVKKFEPGDIAFGEGDVADGIYIVVTGLFMINYTPSESVLHSLREFGRLPIVDYLSGTKYGEAGVDYIVSGNCIGERSFLTGRSYNSTITADSHSQVYVLSYGVLQRAAELSPDPIMGLECRIWKAVSIRIAVSLLLSVPAYQTFSQDQIKYALERAFVPNLRNYKIFAVTEMIQDIVLIEGVACDYNTRETFVAPYCIPRTVQKLILPSSSLINIPIDIETKLLLIPEKDVDEYDVMMAAEETCEMVDTGLSSKCLQHVIQHRASLQKRKIKMRDINWSTREHRNKLTDEVPSTTIEIKKSSIDAVESHQDEVSTYLSDYSTITSNIGIDDDEKERQTFDYQYDTKSKP